MLNIHNFSSPYLQEDGSIVDSDKHEVWLGATGWEPLLGSEDDDEAVWTHAHPEKQPRSVADYLLLCLAIDRYFEPPYEGYVYLLTSPSHQGVWKIGQTTQSPDKRCKQINRSQINAADWQVMYSLKTEHFKKIESAAKQQFGGKTKYQTEYFACDISEVIEFIEEMEKNTPKWTCPRRSLVFPDFSFNRQDAITDS